MRGSGYLDSFNWLTYHENSSLHKLSRPPFVSECLYYCEFQITTEDFCFIPITFDTRFANHILIWSNILNSILLLQPFLFEIMSTSSNGPYKLSWAETVCRLGKNQYIFLCFSILSQHQYAKLRKISMFPKYQHP